MKLQISLALLLGASTLFANESLITKAKNAGLEAIPSNKQVLMKLIDDPKDPITDSKVELGKKLYFDPRLSRSNLISCNTCHNLALGGADGVPAAIGSLNFSKYESPTSCIILLLFEESNIQSKLETSFSFLFTIIVSFFTNILLIIFLSVRYISTSFLYFSSRVFKSFSSSFVT